MNIGNRAFTIASIAALVLVACGEPAPTNEGVAQSGAGVENRVEASAEHTGRGTLNSIDLAAGTVSISHEAVASAGWPAMTMSFKLADPAAVPEVTPGQRIEFRFTTEGGGTVTAIGPAE
jgi:Cu/Ag efflux protein CusF